MPDGSLRKRARLRSKPAAIRKTDRLVSIGSGPDRQNAGQYHCLPVHVARLADLDDEGKMQDYHASLSKAFCTAKMRETVAWARELFGGNGIVVDYNVARFFADSEALYSYEGTFQMQNLIVGKAVTGFSAFV